MEFNNRNDRESISEKKQVERIIDYLDSLDDILDSSISSIKGVIKEHVLRTEEK
jgi:hypothetical protein